jgi:hypothetical protein
VTSASWSSNVPGIVAAVQAAQDEATRDVTEDLASRSADRVPYEEGDLDRSRHVQVERDGDEVHGVVSYDTVYARVQHEHPEYQHANGRTAYYLSAPLDENRARYQALLAERLREAHGG